MTVAQQLDGVIVLWGERLFYPGNRIVKADPAPRLDAGLGQKAAFIRRRIEATVARRAPQVMVKVTGGGRGMNAIAAHFRYISKNGRLTLEDDRGAVRAGKESLRELTDQWRFAGSLIPEEGHRREAFNIMLSMPAGTDAGLLHKAVREFAQSELAEHRYVMVLHDHQANPHVHLSVRAESRTGKRLNPRKADLHRWRETFAEKLRGWGIDAEASRQPARGATRNFEPLWRVKAREDGRLRKAGLPSKAGREAFASRAEAMESWMHIAQALAGSPNANDRRLAERVTKFVRSAPCLERLQLASDHVAAIDHPPRLGLAREDVVGSRNDRNR